MNESGDFDQAARAAIKLAPEAVLRWAVETLPLELLFTSWIDTRTIPFPGESDRVCDTVAELRHREELAVPWALIAEVQTRPDANFPERVVEYAARFRRELRHGPHGRDRYNVGAVLIQLTGSKPANRVEMALPGTEVQMLWGFAVMPVAKQSATALLERIAAEPRNLALLCWVPPMQGGTDLAVVVEWVRLAGLEMDEHRRRVYGAVALTFAELSDNPAVWQKALEGWGVEKSALWERIRKESRLEGHVEGRAEGVQKSLLKFLRTRLDPIPQDIQDAIRAQSNADLLDRWFEQALQANTPDEVRTILATR